MGKNCFYKISRYLHFVDNEMVSEEQKKDRVRKLHPWLTLLCDNFAFVSNSEEHHSIDMRLWLLLKADQY